MKLTLGTNDIFKCPEGRYRGVLERVGEPKTPMKKPCKDQVRFTYRVKAEKSKEYLVGRTFCADLSYGCELYAFLESWLDGKFDQYLDESGQIDLNLLLGKEADLLITHYEDGSHPHPFVNVSGVFRPGTLIEN